MDINIKGNPGSGNTFLEIHIDHVENYNPNATTVTNNYYGTREKRHSQAGIPSGDLDTTPIRKEILNYVSGIRPYLKDEWKACYMKMWEGILDLDMIAADVYKPGKQQGTNFNRSLVANIIHYLDGHHIYKEPYSPTTMVMALEGNKDHPARGPLSKDPTTDIVSRLDRFLETFEL